MKLNQIKKLILEYVAFEDMEDGRPIIEEEKVFKRSLMACKDTWAIIITLRNAGVDLYASAEMLLDILSYDTITYNEKSK